MTVEDLNIYKNKKKDEVMNEILNIIKNTNLKEPLEQHVKLDNLRKISGGTHIIQDYLNELIASKKIEVIELGGWKDYKGVPAISFPIYKSIV